MRSRWPPLAFGFDDHMDVGMLLIGVKDPRISVLKGELLACEFAGSR